MKMPCQSNDLRSKFETDREYDDWFDTIFAAFSRHREDHEFVGYNQSIGIWIYGKEHLKHEMKKRGMVPYDALMEFANEFGKKKPYEISDKAKHIVKSLRLMADKKGNLRLGGQAIKALKEIGAIKEVSPYAPERLELKGGYS